MPGRVNGFVLAYGSIGAVVLWSGVKGWTISDTMRNLLSGKAPTTNEEPIDTSSSSTSSSTIGSTSTAPAADTSAHSAAAQAAQNTATLLAAPYGWSSGTQWDDLLSLWNAESGWSNTAQNPTSEAYGIPQANPYTKMPKAAWPPTDGGSSSVTAQITWGLEYIKDTYGSPEAAWAHEEANGWY